MLAAARKFIDHARDALNDDSDRVNVGRSVSTIRFDAEEVSIYVAEAMFKRFGPDKVELSNWRSTQQNAC